MSHTLRYLALATLLTGLAAGLATRAALAQEGGPPSGGWTLGLSGFGSDTPYGFRSTTGAPLIEYENDYFKLGLPATEIKLPWLSGEQLSFGVSVELFGSEGGYKSSDAPQLHGMARRDSGLWAGPRVGYRNDLVELSFRALRDLGGDSNGTSLEIGAAHDIFAGDRLMISPGISAVWLDQKTVDYYYGVQPGEATATRAAYRGKATTNLKLGVNFGYMLSETQMLMLDVSATKLGNGITGSPIVTDDMLTSVGLHYMLRF